MRRIEEGEGAAGRRHLKYLRRRRKIETGMNDKAREQSETRNDGWETVVFGAKRDRERERAIRGERRCICGGVDGTGVSSIFFRPTSVIYKLLCTRPSKHETKYKNGKTVNQSEPEWEPLRFSFPFLFCICGRKLCQHTLV